MKFFHLIKNLCTCGFTLGRSRNKVMVGEPVVGYTVINLMGMV